MLERKHDFTSAEIKAGVFVLVSAAVLVLFGFAIHGYMPEANTKEFYALMEDTHGLNNGAYVRFGGKKAGRVTGIAVDPDQRALIRVSFRVDESVPVNADSVAYVGQTTLTAEKHLEITTGSVDAALLETGREVPVQGGAVFDEAGVLARKVSQTLDDVMKLLGVEEAEGSEEGLTSLADLLDGLDGTIGEGKGLVEDARGIVDDSRAHIETILTKVEEVEDDADAIVGDVSKIVEEISGTVTNARQNIETSIATVRDVLSRVDKATAGMEDMAASLERALASADSLSAEAASMVEANRPELEELVRDLRETVRHLKSFSRTIADEPHSVIRGTQPKGRRSP